MALLFSGMLFRGGSVVDAACLRELDGYTVEAVGVLGAGFGGVFQLAVSLFTCLSGPTRG